MISIVIPLYNKGNLVVRALNSIRNQIYDDYEVVIIDDGSTDNSVDIAREFISRNGMERVRIVSQSNRGVGAARNHGIRISGGDFIAFLDADDEWKDNHLYDLYVLTEQFPQCQVFATNYEYKSPEGVVTCNRLKNQPFKGDYGIIDNYFVMASGSTPPLHTSATMVSREALLSIGGFPENIKSGEDLLTWARLALVSDIGFFTKSSAVYQLGHSNPRPPETTDFVGSQFELIYREKPLAAGLRDYIALWFNMRMSRCLAHRDYTNALKAFVKTMRYRPTLRILKPMLRFTLLGLKNKR